MKAKMSATRKKELELEAQEINHLSITQQVEIVAHFVSTLEIKQFARFIVWALADRLDKLLTAKEKVKKEEILYKKKRSAILRETDCRIREMQAKVGRIEKELEDSRKRVWIERIRRKAGEFVVGHAIETEGDERRICEECNKITYAHKEETNKYVFCPDCHETDLRAISGE